ncbi:hypothetical protein GGX14DRAFT_475483 [Mycena pura]|uniref:Uncharacterized protein n=1 Tax=Mycena pura TaxID=153505 RepID=A0AAD6UW45_9AGAR|nr:hypothetical protein GGX14DRAFT_475483 [Mycena pura]
MSQHSTPWGRSDRRSTTGSGSLRASRLGAHHSRFRSDHSFHDNRFYDPSSTTPSNKRSDSDSCVKSISSYVGDRFTSNHRSGYQWSLVLDPSVVAANFAHTSDTGTPSLTSSNNFINFCDTVTVSPTPITNGQQIAGESCNPAPMGRIPTIDNLPSVRITQPTNLATLQKNTSISLQFIARNLQGGVFVNPTTRYLSEPQDVDDTGNVIGHFHVVIEELDALNSTIPPDIRNFVFFSVIHNPFIGSDSIQSSIPNGLPVGFYRATVTTHAASYQPVLAPIAQHGSLNDVAYFTVTADGTPGSTPAVTRRTLIPEMNSQRNPFEPTLRVIARAEADAQSSLTLLPSLIAAGFSDDGQNPPVAGQTAAATSNNNFINFCALTLESVPLTDGLQIATGSCNPAPMGVLPASTRLVCRLRQRAVYILTTNSARVKIYVSAERRNPRPRYPDDGWFGRHQPCHGKFSQLDRVLSSCTAAA